MDGRAAVHRDGRDGVLSHQGDQQRSQAHLDDVPAQHGDDGAAPCGRHDLIDDIAKVLRGKNRRQRVDEGGERTIRCERCVGDE